MTFTVIIVNKQKEPQPKLSSPKFTSRASTFSKDSYYASSKKKPKNISST